MEYTKDQVEAALAEAKNIARVLGDNHPTVILASELRDARAERDRLRELAEEALGVFIENASWLLPMYEKTVRQLEAAIEGTIVNIGNDSALAGKGE